jgi:hypothetical protein
MTTMSLRKSESVCRLLIGVSLALGFVGFATHSRAEPRADKLAVAAECAPAQAHDAL